MVLDVVAILTPTAGKEGRVEELIRVQLENTNKYEPGMYRHCAYKRITDDGLIEFVIIQRYKDKEAYDEHFRFDHYSKVKEELQLEGLVSKPLNYLRLEPVEGGFERE